MNLEIKISAYKLKQGEDYPYQDEVGACLSNHIDQKGMMIIEIDGSEYHFDKNQLKKAIEILDME